MHELVLAGAHDEDHARATSETCRRQIMQTHLVSTLNTTKRITMRHAISTPNDSGQIRLIALPRLGMQNPMAKLGLSILELNIRHLDIQEPLPRQRGNGTHN